MLSALFGALVIGLSLSLLGAGGAILTVPVLQYGFGISAERVPALALVVVTLVSMMSFFQEGKNLSRWKAEGGLSVSLWFSILGAVSSFVAARLSHLIPADFRSVGFATLLVFAAGFMFQNALKTSRPRANNSPSAYSKILIPVAALILGALTGVFGVGGGFLLVPTLLLTSRLEFRDAVISSLVVIFTNSITALVGYALIPKGEEVTAISIVTAFGVLGSLGGRWLKVRFNIASNERFNRNLKIIFSLVLFGLSIRYISAAF